jgi:hypothetical protein
LKCELPDPIIRAECAAFAHVREQYMRRLD